MRPALCHALKSTAFQHLLGPCACLRARDALQLKRKRYVVDDALAWDKQILLEHVADVSRMSRDVRAMQQHPALLWLQKSRKCVEQCCLATARATNQAGNGARLQLNRDILSNYLAVSPNQRKVACFKRWRVLLRLACRCSS